MWTVDKLNRAGTDFVDLPQAVAAAAPGDVLLLRFTLIPVQEILGPWADYTAPTIDGKGVSIVGEGTTPVRVVGEWMVRNVPRGQVVSLTNLQTVHRAEWGTTPRIDSRLDFFNNRGAVVLDSLHRRSGPSHRVLAPFIQDCDLVVLSRSNLITID